MITHVFASARYARYALSALACVGFALTYN